MIKKLFLKYKEIISYVFFGVLATIVNLVSFKLFDAILGADLYLFTNVISWVITVIFAYFTNKLWVFESKSWKLSVVMREMVGFFGARLFSLGVEEAGLWLMLDDKALDMGGLTIDIFGIVIDGNMIAKIIMQVVVVILNYVFSKLIIFKKKKNDEKN
ncbi:MAG: GtrA family protein [Eubacterium sp.]